MITYNRTCGAKFFNLHSSYLPQWLHKRMETFHVDGGDGFDEPFSADEAGSSSYSKLLSMSLIYERVI